MKTSRETLAILQEHYPERLAVAVCYNPPWIFAVFWKAISPFIDPNTYRKIRFVNPKREKEVRRMRTMFDMSCVEHPHLVTERVRVKGGVAVAPDVLVDA